MTDIQRIDRILKLIEQHWKAYPDLRFGQLLINLGIAPDAGIFWHLADEDIEEHLKEVKIR